MLANQRRRPAARLSCLPPPANLGLVLLLAGFACLAVCPFALAQESPFLADLHVDTLDCANKKKLAPDLDAIPCQVTKKTLDRGNVRLLVVSLWTPWRRGMTEAEGSALGWAALGNFHRLLALNPDVSFLSEGVDAAEDGVHVVAALEGLQVVQQEPATIDAYLDLGVRVVGVVHNLANRFAFPSTAQGLEFGLTADGRRMVRYVMERGAFVDVSHLSEAGTADVLAVAKELGAPVLATHSACRALREHPRNLSDDQLRAIAATDGLIGILFHSPFLVEGARRASLEDVADHVLHAVSVAGSKHVAFGSDFDGSIRPPEILPTPGEIPFLADVLRRRGLSDDEIRDVFGRNAARVFARQRMKHATNPFVVR